MTDTALIRIAIIVIVPLIVALLAAILWQLRELRQSKDSPKARGPGFWEKVWDR